MTGIVYIHCTV